MAELLHYDNNEHEIYDHNDDIIIDNDNDNDNDNDEEDNDDDDIVEEDDEENNDDEDNDDEDNEDNDNDNDNVEEDIFTNLLNTICTIYNNEVDDNNLHNLLNEQEYIYDKLLIYISNKKYINALFIFSILFILITENSLFNSYIVSLAYFIVICIILQDPAINKFSIIFMDVVSIFVCFIFVLENNDIYLINHFCELSYTFGKITACYYILFFIILIFNILNINNELFKNTMKQFIFIATILFFLVFIIYFCIFLICLFNVLINFTT
jgi:hypothetical protein